MKKIINSCKGTAKIISYVIDIALVTTLVPVIKTLVSSSSSLECPSGYENLTGEVCQLVGNHSQTISANVVGLSNTETTLLLLTALFIIIALVYTVGKQSGLIKNKE